MMFPQRPSCKDSEEDLLDFQDKFLASGKKPSAKVVKCSRENKKEFGKDFIKLENYEISRDSTEQSETEITGKKENEDMMIEMDKYDTHVTKVLSNIIKERDVPNKPILFPAFQSHAFPPLYKCQKRSTGVKKSMFAQQFQAQDVKKKACNQSTSKSGSLEESTSANLQEMFPPSRVISGDGLIPLSNNRHQSVDPVCQIHEENIKQIAGMTEQEILQEQQKIRTLLNPKTIDFLINMKKQKTTVGEKLMGNTTQKKDKSTADIPHEKNVLQQSDVLLSEQLIKQRARWMGMEKVEDEKMEWMKLFDQNNCKVIDHPTRFDFEGKLLSVDKSQNIPTYVGLHHHGKEASLAGYTLQELLTMVRSEFLQQRVISLKVLDRIIRKEKMYEYQDNTTTNLMQVLLDAGLVFVLRWALDDRSYICMQAAVSALSALLSTSEGQRKFLEINFLSHRGLEQPFFQLYNRSQKLETLELLKKDLILGLLSMNLLPRIRYILEVCNPDTQMKINCLQILERISSHSIDASLKVLDCPRLIKFLVNTYIENPAKESFPDLKHLDALPQVTRIFVNIALTGRYACNKLFQQHESIYKLVTKFLAEVGGFAGKEGDDNTLETSILESELNVLKFWIIGLSYGQMLDLFRDMGTSLLLQLQACNKILIGKYNIAQLKWLKHVLKLVSSAACNLESNDIAFSGYVDVTITIAKDAFKTLKSCKKTDLKKCLKGVLALALDVIGTFYSRLHKYSAIDAVQLATNMETSVLPLIQSLQNFIFEQSICWSNPSAASDGSSLPSLPDLQLNHISEKDMGKMLEFVAVQMLWSSYLRCCFIMAKCCRSVCSALSSLLKIIPSKFTTNYTKGAHWYFNRYATYSMYWAVKLFVVTMPHVKDLDEFKFQYHFVALQCFSLLGSGDEFYAHDLLSTVLFHKEMISQDKQNLEEKVLVEELPIVQSGYMFCFTIADNILANSKFRCTPDPPSVNTFLVSYGSLPLLPLDWIFMPLIQAYDATVQRGETSNPREISHVLRTTRVVLKFILLVEKTNPNYMTHICLEAKLTRLMCVFLSGSDIFLEPTVHGLLSTLFGFYCSNCEVLDFEAPIAGLTSFFDFYTSLLEQFEAVSYGDKLFSSVVLLPLAQSCYAKYKLALWSQHRDSLRVITLNTDQTLLLRSAYLQPLERSTQVLYAYIHAIAGGYCQYERNPFLYQIAVHHIASFIFQRTLVTEMTIRRKMLNVVESVKDELFRKHILRYDISAEIPNRFESLNYLPAWNETVLKHLRS
uniref:RNA polymerase II-associated protein 1-like n=1 Tax=Phallusia mammillata TaxID=59560 RepID=A0A6F9DQG4_9ASCI|nr:RNA polymerase II-associated protein 1-like [Phallusia mammillata]